MKKSKKTRCPFSKKDFILLKHVLCDDGRDMIKALEKGQPFTEFLDENGYHVIRFLTTCTSSYCNKYGNNYVNLRFRISLKHSKELDVLFRKSYPHNFTSKEVTTVINATKERIKLIKDMYQFSLKLNAARKLW